MKCTKKEAIRDQSVIRAVIFDCFGVVLADALEVMCNDLAKTEPEKVRQIQEVLLTLMAGEMSSDEGDKVVAQLFGLSPEEYTRRKYGGEVRNTELLEYIKGLRTKYKVAMLTNIGKGGLQKRFDVHELDEYFDTVVASGDVGFAKPEARVYELTAARLEVRLDECVFIDDREAYCEGARAVGMKTIEYSSFPQMKAELEKYLG